MKRDKDFYGRRAMPEEVERGALFIAKTALPFFPPMGTPFALETASGTAEVAVEAVHCICRGPEKPHEHYWLPVPGIELRALVTIMPPSEAGGPYHATVARKVRAP